MNGLLLVNKQSNITSSDVVIKVRKLLNIKKVGHTGTLDPLAEGLLILTVGNATRIQELITEKDKEYIATMKLGIKTDTYDTEGKIIDQKEVPNNLNIEEVLNSYIKKYNQEVPIYSSIKVNGKKLYEYARENIEVELPKREVEIKDIKSLSINNNEVTFKCLVSKGTYIRSLINDIGNTLGTYATMTKLIRTKIDNFSLDNSYTLEDIEKGNYKLISIEEILDYPKIEIDDNLYKKISNGVVLDNTYNIKDKVLFIYNSNVKAIYYNDNNKLKVYRVFN